MQEELERGSERVSGVGLTPEGVLGGSALRGRLGGSRPSSTRRREIHLRELPPSEGPLRHIGFEGEFHRSGLPLSEVPERPIR